MSLISKASGMFDYVMPVYTYFSGSERVEPVDEEPLEVKMRKIALDPMSVMVELGLLYHQKIGTKLNIYDHRIYFQGLWKSQGVVRAFQGASRDNLVALKPIIHTALRWYQPRTNEKVQRIFLRTIKGLKVLRETYKASVITVDLINGMIKSIVDAIEKGVPKKDPENSYQLKVKAMWVKEIDGVSILLDKLPGDFSTVVVQEEDLKTRKEDMGPQVSANGNGNAAAAAAPAVSISVAVSPSPKSAPNVAAANAPSANGNAAAMAAPAASISVTVSPSPKPAASNEKLKAKEDVVDKKGDEPPAVKKDAEKAPEKAKEAPKPKPVDEAMVPQIANIQFVQAYINDQTVKFEKIVRDEVINFLTLSVDNVG